MWDGSVGATLKAPFVQTPGGTLSGPPGNINMAGTVPFPSLSATAVSSTLTTGHHLRVAQCTSPAPSEFLPPRDALLRSAGQKGGNPARHP